VAEFAPVVAAKHGEIRSTVQLRACPSNRCQLRLLLAPLPLPADLDFRWACSAGLSDQWCVLCP
jgi:hypothetical protein